MKSVDITLLFQAIHFFIAYFVIKKYIVYPAAEILDQQEFAEKKLRADIHHVSLQKQDGIERKKQRWLDIKLKLQDMIPFLGIVHSSKDSQKDILISKANRSLTYDQKKELKNQMKQSLMDR